MHKKKLYIIQAIGVVVLLFAYFLGDRPDGESVMHFDLSAKHIISSVGYGGNQPKIGNTIMESNRGHHKQRSVKIYSFNVILPKPISIFCYSPIFSIKQGNLYRENYIFLYSKEINPPPPKACQV
jgi:hypothetical protein